MAGWLSARETVLAGLAVCFLTLTQPAAPTAAHTAEPSAEMGELADRALRELAQERERMARLRLFGLALIGTLLISAAYFAVWAALRQRGERISRENEARLRAIMGTVADAIVTMDDRGVIVAVNAAAERLFGRPESGLVGASVDLLMPEPQRSSHGGFLRRYLESGAGSAIGRSRELEAVRADGMTLPVELRLGEFRRGQRRFFTATLRDLTERRRAEVRLRLTERRLADIAGNFPGVIHQCVLTADGRFSYRYASAPLADFEGETPGEASLEEHSRRMAPEDRQRWLEAIRRSAATLGTFEMERRVPTAQGERWIRTVSRPHREPDGAIVWNGVAIDVTDRKRAEEHQTLLMAELDHRVKNTLATVQAIASQTLPTSEAHRAFSGRLAALAHTHGLLAQSRWTGARLADIVAEELAPYRDAEGGRVSVEGPDVLLEPKAAQALALAIHELTTNAAKFGALSVPDGRLAIGWRAEGEAPRSRLSLLWTESGGPAVEPPSRRGFGSLLIERSLEYELGGEVELDYRREGLRCQIELPLPRRRAQGRSPEPATPAAEAPAAALTGARVLVVEDSHVVALETQEILTEAGCEVVGPAPTLEGALELARREALDAAILDVDLGGEAVYPVADLLRASGVPFLFASGYDLTGGIPAAHRAAQRLAKPIDPRDLLAALRRLLARSQGRATRQTSP